MRACIDRVQSATVRRRDQANKGSEGGGCYRPADEIALHVVAAAGPQEIDLRLGFHAFGDHLDLQLLRQRDDRAGDRLVVVVARNILDEGPVDLQPADGKALQRAEAGIAGAEIVDGR